MLARDASNTDADLDLAGAAWSRIEDYTAALWLPGPAARSAVSVVRVVRPETVPMIARYGRTEAAITLTSVEAWSAGAWVSAPYVEQPDGLALQAGDYRITAAVEPTLADVPDSVTVAAGRVYAYMYHHAPARQADEFGGGAPPNLSGVVLKSGAAQLLTRWRRVA